MRRAGPILVLLTLAFIAGAQIIPGRNPADQFVPQFFLQNNNAETMVAGINRASVKVTNVDWSLDPNIGGGSTNLWVQSGTNLYPGTATGIASGWVSTNSTIYPQ